MVKRITCGFVASLLLVLWQVSPAAAQEKAPQMIALLEEYHVHPEGTEGFVASMKSAKDAAAAHGYPYGWDVYAMDDMRYVAITWVDGMAGIDEMQAAWADAMKEWGPQASTEWIDRISATLSYWDTSVWKARPDLSYRPADDESEHAYVVWGLISIKPGHQDEVEALFQEYLGVFAERKFPYGWRAAELVLGPGYPTLAFVDWASSPGTYWTRHDKEEKDEVLGARSAEIWQEMLPHIRNFDYVTGHYLKELSYHPAKVAEE